MYNIIGTYFNIPLVEGFSSNLLFIQTKIMNESDFNFLLTLQLNIAKIFVQVTRILCSVWTLVWMDSCLHLEALMALLKSGMHLQETLNAPLKVLVEALRCTL